ncbi:hypothetical protein DFR70_10966 [Nocardia tenerifensis]|uniref:Saccharopine dehydrogenase n=1 Tax=Nocardia tenerifensis TaxID=228006 RepID=A0A318K141_9NOCA|nr:hypothetical protein [Nocardia tenerifensis]PXX60875.1 hypothetical protein DFR70_10966 [Nocardia tenerifensis]
MAVQSDSVLILGGSGQAGAGAAAMLRRWYPSLPLTIAGRDLARAQRIADELGSATAVTIDLERDDLGLPEAHRHSAVVAALWDGRRYGLRYAQQRGLPYLNISSGLVDIAPEVIAGAQRATAPILVASHVFAGVAVLAAIHSAEPFDRVDTVRLGAVLDATDIGGPAGLADLERLAVATSAAMVRRDGVFTWTADTQTEVRGADGATRPGQAIATLDVPSIAFATGAPNVRFDFAIGDSLSAEVRIDIEGVDRAGAPLRVSRSLIHPAGQRPLTALGIALGVERLLALRGAPVPPGIHTPESLIDPAYAVERMYEIGAVFSDAQVS